MSRPAVEDQPQHYRNGVYPHSSFRKPHRVRIVDVGGMAVIVVLIAGLFGVAVGLLLGAAWMIRTFWSLLVGGA